MVKKIKRMKPWKRKANVILKLWFQVVQKNLKHSNCAVNRDPFDLIYLVVIGKSICFKTASNTQKYNPLIPTWKYVYCIPNIQVEGETDLPGYRCLEGTEVLKTYQENSYRRKLFRKKGNFNIELSPEVTKR